MNGFFLQIEVKDGEIEKIMKELDEAQEKISECYQKLIELGVVTVTKDKATSK